MVCGHGIGSSYQQQGLALSKQFRSVDVPTEWATTKGDPARGAPENEARSLRCPQFCGVYGADVADQAH